MIELLEPALTLSLQYSSGGRTCRLRTVWHDVGMQLHMDELRTVVLSEHMLQDALRGIQRDCCDVCSTVLLLARRTACVQDVAVHLQDLTASCAPMSQRQPCDNTEAISGNTKRI